MWTLSSQHSARSSKRPNRGGDTKSETLRVRAALGRDGEGRPASLLCGEGAANELALLPATQGLSGPLTVTANHLAGHVNLLLPPWEWGVAPSRGKPRGQ